MGAGFLCDVCGELFEGAHTGSLSGTGNLVGIEDEYCGPCSRKVKAVLEEMRKKR
jgi:hypothetical protein